MQLVKIHEIGQKKRQEEKQNEAQSPTSCRDLCEHQLWLGSSWSTLRT